MAHRALIVMAPYSAQWPCVFAAERAAMATALAPHPVHIEHVGSTAVPGLAAKPIIDIMLGMSSLALVEGQVEALRRLGYQYMPEHEVEIPQRRFFAKPTIRPRQFHLHAVIVGQTFWNEHLRFRDALRADGRLAQAYALLKYSLAAQYKDDREGYTSAKASFIASVVQKAQRPSRNGT